MILLEAVSASTPTAVMLAENGITLVPADRSPLHRLISEMHSDPVSMEGIDKALYQAANNQERALSLTELTEVAADSAARTYTLVKNTILPHIRRVIESVRSKQHALDKSVIPFTVVFAEEYQILKLDTLKDLIVNFTRLDPETEVNVGLGSFEDHEILDRIKYSDSEDFNGVLAKGLSEKDRLVTVRNVINGSSKFSNWNDDPYVLAALLLFVQTIDEPQEGVACSLDDYRQQIRAIVQQSADKLRVMVAKDSAKITNHNVYSYGGDTAVNQIVLVRSVFENMVKENGLTIEVILGNEFLDRKYPTGAALTNDEVRAELTKAYSNHVAQLKANVTRRIDSESRRVLYNAIIEDASTISLNDINSVGLNDTTESLVRRANAVCKSLNEIKWEASTDENIVSAAICSIYYAHTDGPLILELMEKIVTDNPDVPQELIGELAIIQRVALWTSGMVHKLNN